MRRVRYYAFLAFVTCVDTRFSGNCSIFTITFRLCPLYGVNQPLKRFQAPGTSVRNTG
jgi:hypothetical protein